MTNPSFKRLTMVLITYVGWLLLTLFGMRWASDGSKKPLVDTVTHGISWNLVMAVGLLALTTVWMRWHDLKFVVPRPVSSLKVLWFPAVYLLLFGLLAAVTGFPPGQTVLFVLLNTLLVGLSEEWMFRGALFQGLRSVLPMWPSILLTSLLFGGVHILNVFTTGQLGETVVQSVAAFMTGLVMIALLIRTGSLWVPIVYHALWDLGTFVVSAGASKPTQAVDFSQGWTWALPILLVLPNCVYGLFLLRKVRNGTTLTTDLANTA
ncbi:MAG: CPBP family intramembrane metalloprotease [Comamonadaceae bacterium]|nr:CPBP family intramembrane metalloprotease [Comamonadaceae bacterium]